MSKQYHKIFNKYTNDEIDKMVFIILNKNYEELSDKNKIKLENEYQTLGKLYFIETIEDINEYTVFCKNCFTCYKITCNSYNIYNKHITHNIKYIGLLNKIREICIKYIPEIKPISKQIAYIILKDINNALICIKDIPYINYNKINSINKMVYDTVYSLHYKDPVMTDLFIEMIYNLFISIIHQLE